MRRTHFDRLKPICPRCFAQENIVAPLSLSEIALENDKFIIEALITCSNPQCNNEYPVIDGIPIIVTNVRDYLKNNFQSINAPQQHSQLIESVLSDAMGPGSEYNNTKHHISSYGWDHYGDLAPDGEFEGESHSAAPGSAVSCLNRALSLISGQPKGPMLDVGCALGRTSFELSEKYDSLVLGIDINFAKLKVAQKVLREGMVSFSLKQLGVAYKQHSYLTSFENKQNVDFWVCNAMALPFRNQQFYFSSLLNVFDVVPAPKTLLYSLNRILAKEGQAILSTPYDWSTPVNMDVWLGGKKFHHEYHGDSAQMLKGMFSTDLKQGELKDLYLIGEISHHPWFVRVHKRRTVNYDAHIIACHKK